VPDIRTLRPPIRALAIGAGITSHLIHLPILARLRKQGAVDLSIICDLESARAVAAQKKFGFREHCGDAGSALERADIDAVYVFGSAQMHFELGLRAVRAGKHLFVEKPIAPSWTQACMIVREARKSGVIAAGGHNRRFHKSLAAVRARGGNAGWHYVEASFHKPGNGKPAPFGARTWLSANGIHALDVLVFMMGGLPDVMTSFRDGETFSSIMRWSNGAQGAFLCDNNAGRRAETYAFHATGLTCAISDAGLEISSGNRTSKLGLSPVGDGFDAEHASFLDAIATGDEPPHSIAALAPSLFLAEQIERAHSGKIVLPPEAARPHLVSGSSPIGTVLVDRAFAFDGALGRLQTHFNIAAVDDISRSKTARPDVVGIILGRGAPPLAQATLDALPNLRAVGIAALSLAHYDPGALLARGITLFNATASYADSVAEFALALAILGRRCAFESHELMRQGGWGIRSGKGGLSRRLRGSARYIARALRVESALREISTRSGLGVGAVTSNPGELRGATVGLIGWGSNARAFSARLNTAGANVLAFSEHAPGTDIEGATRASLGQVLAADIVSLHRGLTPRTRHFLGAAELARLRPGSVLINIARGALIEPDALLQRLRKGDIFACLDTFECEPLASRSALRTLPNVFLTSHIAGGSGDMHAAAAKEIVAKMEQCLAGKRVDAITSDRLDSMT
jgi:phosphoglycerate dehydrogenase-like enzyme/predicted dehydrogenase